MKQAWARYVCRLCRRGYENVDFRYGELPSRDLDLLPKSSNLTTAVKARSDTVVSIGLLDLSLVSGTHVPRLY